MLALFAVVMEGAADHGSKTAFYVAGGVFAAWAVLVGAIGVMRPAFPRGDGAARGVMLVSGLLMVATMTAAIVTSS